MQVVKLPGHLIGPRAWSRGVDKSKAATIAESIKEVGLLSPIIVAAGKRVRNGCEVDGWDILAGQHRFHAMHSILGWEDIPCVVCEASDLIQQLIVIDENLARSELSVAERAEHMAKRKEIYEALHPETKHGSNQHSRSRNRCDSSLRFTKATATATGRSERSVQQDTHRGEHLANVIPRIKGTSLDVSSELDALIKLKPEEREAIVSKAEKGERVSAKPPGPPTKIIRQTDTLRTLLEAWDAATPEDHRQLIEMRINRSDAA